MFSSSLLKSLKIERDHKKKSNQVKKLKRKLKNHKKHSISLAELEYLLTLEKQGQQNHWDYMRFGEFNQSGYDREDGAREGKIELLTSIIDKVKKQKY